MFSTFRAKWRARRAQEKCRKCGALQLRSDMHRIQFKSHFRLPLPLLIARNFVGLFLGYRPEHISRRAWLFGNEYKKLETKKVMRWVCFDCYIQVLTPREYDVFRSAYYDDLAREQGREQAAAFIAHMDAVFADRGESA